jgi:hypothetical protein
MCDLASYPGKDYVPNHSKAGVIQQHLSFPAESERQTKDPTTKCTGCSHETLGPWEMGDYYIEADMTAFFFSAGETGTRVCLTGGLGTSSQRRAKKIPRKRSAAQEGRKRKRLGSMDMVVFDCEDDEESRPAATGGGAFNFGCLGVLIA